MLFVDDCMMTPHFLSGEIQVNMAMFRADAL
jgi:hypothetical protein